MRRVRLLALLALLPCIAPCTGYAQATRSGQQTSVPAASIVDPPLTGTGTPASHLACPTASGAQSGCLGASDWTTFNSKQPGPLTGDVTTSGTAATLAASGVSPNTYGSFSQHAVVTFDAKGRATIATNVNPSLPTSAITSGTFADSLLASAYSGVGACGANTWASTLTRNASPTCTQPAFSNISGTAATGQIPSLDTSKITTGTFTDAFLASAYGGVGTCTNQFVSATSRNAAPTCTTATLAGPQYANQGTTTTVLHGNGAGNPSWAAVSLTADVSGTLPIGNGGTGATTTSQNFAFVGPTSGSGAPSFRALVAGDIPSLDTGKITTGTFADGFLTSAYSGVGACGANTWASTLSRNAAPTCTQPAFTNISGTASTAQIPNLDGSKITTGALSGTGSGSGAGVSGTGGSTSGTGVVGTGGSTNGIGVSGVGTGTGAGGTFSSTTGYGVSLTGNATRAPLALGSLAAAPSTSANGDSYFDSVIPGFRVFYGGIWNTLGVSGAGAQLTVANTWTAKQTFQPGSGDAVLANGNGTGSGVVANGGATGSAITATGGATSGYAAKLSVSTNVNAPLNLLPNGGVSGDPSSLSDGDFWFNGNTFSVRVRTNGTSYTIAPLKAGTVILVSGTPSTQTVNLVLAGMVCTCSAVTAAADNANLKCSVSGATLTVTGPNTNSNTFAYTCMVPQ